MLDNARKYKDELKAKFMDLWYDDKYKYYFSHSWHNDFDLPNDDWEIICHVSIDENNKIIGYISYGVDRSINSVHNFEAVNFTENKIIFGTDLYKIIDDIFCKFNINRMEFSVVCGNPIEKSYDKMVIKHGGRILCIRKEAVKLIDNKIYDEKLYEILRKDYISTKYNK